MKVEGSRVFRGAYETYRHIAIWVSLNGSACRRSNQWMNTGCGFKPLSMCLGRVNSCNSSTDEPIWLRQRKWMKIISQRLRQEPTSSADLGGRVCGYVMNHYLVGASFNSPRSDRESEWAVMCLRTLDALHSGCRGPWKKCPRTALRVTKWAENLFVNSQMKGYNRPIVVAAKSANMCKTN